MDRNLIAPHSTAKEQAFIQSLTSFLQRAMIHTYAAAGGVPWELQPQRKGFIEYDYFEQESAWRYRDSYAGFLTSAGQEVVWFGDVPVWYQSYSGGVTNPKECTTERARQIFAFLKEALRKKSEESFQPRGPRLHENDDFVYQATWHGTIRSFTGTERIAPNSRIIHASSKKDLFVHAFSGGLLDWGEKRPRPY